MVHVFDDFDIWWQIAKPVIAIAVRNSSTNWSWWIAVDWPHRINRVTQIEAGPTLSTGAGPSQNVHKALVPSGGAEISHSMMLRYVLPPGGIGMKARPEPNNPP